MRTLDAIVQHVAAAPRALADDQMKKLVGELDLACTNAQNEARDAQRKADAAEAELRCAKDKYKQSCKHARERKRTARLADQLAHAARTTGAYAAFRSALDRHAHDVVLLDIDQPRPKRQRPSAPPGTIEVVSLLSPLRDEPDDDDDDLCVVRQLAVKPRSSAHTIVDEPGDSDGETRVVGETRGVRALRDLAHPRPLCLVHPFGKGDDALKSCVNCYCVKCEVPAEKCAEWVAHAELEIPRSEKVD